MKGSSFKGLKLLEEKSIDSCDVQHCYIRLKKPQTTPELAESIWGFLSCSLSPLMLEGK